MTKALKSSIPQVNRISKIIVEASYLEGDLQKLFFDEFRSKGANISYQVRYVNSAEPYGTIVGMSKFNQFLPLEDTITFDISLGNQTAPAATDPE